MLIRKSQKKDVDEIMRIIDQAKKYFHDHEIDQWQNGYPVREDILNDIQQKGSYVLEKNGIVTGTCFIRKLTEPTYAVIKDGRWLNDDPYIVLHRTAVDSAYKGKGYASFFVKKAEELAAKDGIRNLRADTHADNRSMQRMLEKNGFQKCGTIYLKDGSPRTAYQKILQ